MKKTICLLLACSSLFYMSACGKAEDDSKIRLSYEVKYILSSDVGCEEAEQHYYLFERDGTAKYHVYYNSGYSVKSYTIRLKYKIVEEENMVFCFYDGVDYDLVHTEGEVSSSYNSSLMYTEDFLISTGNSMFLSEHFLEELPNFNK